MASSQGSEMKLRRNQKRKLDEEPTPTIKVVLRRSSPLPEYETFDVLVPAIIGIGMEAAEKVARDISRSLREAGVIQYPTIVLEGEDIEVARLAINDTVKSIDFEAEVEALAEVEPSQRDRENPRIRETLLSIGDGEVLKLDLDQAWTLQEAIELLPTIEPLIDRRENFYYDDDRFNNLFMRLQDATGPQRSDLY